MGLLDEYKTKKAAEKQKEKGLLQEYRERKRLQSINTDGVDRNYINSFLQDSTSFFNKAESDGSEYAAWNDLRSRADTVDAWFYKNKGNMSEPEYLRMATTLGRLGDKFTQASDYWAQFGSEDAYQTYVKQKAKRDRLSKIDVNAVAKAKQDYDRLLSEYSDTTYGLSPERENDLGYSSKLRSDVIDLLSKYGYSSYEALMADWEQLDEAKHYQVTLADDYAKYSDMGAAIANPTYDEAQGWLQIGAWRPFGEDVGNIVTFSRDNQEAIDRAMGQNDGNDGAAVLGDYLYRFMTGEEVGIYNYYLTKEGEAKADAYLDYLKDDLKRRHEAGVIQRAISYADEHPILGSALSVLTSLGSGAEYVGDVIRADEMETNLFADITNAIRGTVSEKTSFEIAGWDAGKFLYNTAMSGADSFASSFMGNVGGAMLGLSAAAQGTNDALSRGMSDGQAFWTGLFSGVAEGLFESLSIGNFNALKEVAPDSIKDIAMNIGKSMLVNATEETLTEIANITYDTLVNGMYADYTIDDLKHLGTWAQIGGQIAESALSGALMGAGFGTAGSATGYLSNRHGAAKLANETFGGSREDMQALVGDLLKVDPNNALAKKLQKKLEGGKSLSGREMALAADQISTIIEKQEKSENERFSRDESAFEDLSPALEALLAEWEADSLPGDDHTAEGKSEALEMELTALEESRMEKEADLYRDLGRSGKDFMTARAAMEQDGRAKIPSAEAFRIYTEAKNEAEAETAADRVKVTVTESGEDSSVVRVVATAGGNVTVELADGKRVSVSDLTFDNPDTAVLYTGAIPMNVASANEMIGGFDGTSDALNYVRGWQEAYNSARYGIDLSESRFASTITEEQLETAKRAGKADRSRERAAVGEKRTEKRKGTLHREMGDASLSASQETAVEALERIVQTLGIDIYLYSEADSTHNGWYDRTDGSIHLNLAADLSAEGTLLFTAAHELTHYIRDYAPDKFGTLADFLLTQYGEHGVSVSELVKRQMEIAETDGRQIDYDTAFEEVIASSMETMLQSGNVVEAVAKLKAKDRTLWEKFAQYFRDLADRLRKAFQGLSPSSREGRYVGAMKDAAERLEAMFIDALVTASEREQRKNTAEGGVRYQAIQSQKDPRQLDPRTVTKSDVVGLLEDVKRGAIYGNTYIPIRINTPACLIYWARERRGEIIDNNPIAMSAEKAYQAMARKGSDTKGRPHMLSVNDMVSIIEGMSDPQYIVYQGTNDRYVEVINYSTYEGRKAFAILEVGDAKDSVYMNGYEGGLYNILVTTYPPDTGKLQDLLKNSSNTIIYDKKKDAPQRTSGSTVPSVLNDTPFFIDSIPQDSDSVKRKFSTGARENGKDRTYMDAVERGDAATAQRMVDEAAEMAMPDTVVRDEGGKLLPMYHGTGNGGFTVFSDYHWKFGLFGMGYYFTADREVADSYQQKGKGDRKQTYKVYLDIHRPIDMDAPADLAQWREAISEAEDYFAECKTNEDCFRALKEYCADEMMVRWEAEDLIVDVIRGMGFDGITHIGGGRFNKKDENRHRVYITFDSEQIKSADPVTYDDAGNVIPLSERFNKDSVDIRYSTDSTDVPTLQADNAALRADVKRLVEALHLQKGIGTRFTEETVQAAAKRLMEWAGALGDVRELTGLLHGLYEFIAKGEGVTWDTIRQRSEPIVDWLLANRPAETAVLPEVKELKEHLKGMRVRLSDAQMRQVEALYGSYNEYRKQLFGTVNLSKNADVTLEEIWSELCELFPGVFRSEVDTDMPGVLLDLVRSIRDNQAVRADVFETTMLIEQGLYQQVYESFWDAATMRSLGDIKNREISDIWREHKQQMDAFRQRQENRLKRERKRYQEALEAWRDARERTELRRKAYKVYNELLTLLKDPTKKKHILPELEKAVAEALSVVDMDSVNAAERLERLYSRLEEVKNDDEKSTKILASIERIESSSAKVSERLEKLALVYKAAKDKPDYPDQYGASDILAKIESVKSLVGNTTFVHLDRKQLQGLYDLLVMTRQNVRNANKLFEEKRQAFVTTESNKSLVELMENGKNPATDRFAIFRRQEWNNLKPIYAMEKLGSSSLKLLFDGLLRGESQYGVDMMECRAFFEKVAKECGYDGWDHDEVFHYTSSDGKPFALTLLQKMSLYAYEQRGEVALRHLEAGGLAFANAKKYTKKENGKEESYYVRYGDTYPLTRLQVHEITETLTSEQKQYVQRMQEYLSKNMGTKGNEVARVLYGIDIFGEANYFPMRTKDGGKDQTNAPVDLAKLRERGMTQKTQEHAKNALFMDGFTDVWARHCHEMSLYHSMVLPLENFTRVWNYSAGGLSVKNEVESLYGKEAVAYVEDLLKQLNGGVRTDSVANTWSHMLSSFKKAATFCSLSVVIQQRSAIARAYGELEPRYFIQKKPGKKDRTKTLAEMKKYAGCAAIKEMGGFDTGMSGGSAEWLVRRKYDNKWESMKALITDSAHRDEVLLRMPALIDEVTWCDIWNAVKAETAARNPSLQVDSEAFLKAVGERFTEVIAKTQVYDSVLSRSANMRSKDGLMKMLTAFLAEPTTAINMFGRGIRMMGDPKTKRKGMRYVASVIVAAVYNSALVSVVYAMRDNDEDETYLEKYLSSFLTETADSLNAFSYLPVYKDVISILQGWDIARSDMALLTKAFNELESLGRAFVKGDEEKIGEGWWKVGAAVTDLFGLPLKNILKETKAAFNFVAVLKEDFSGRSTTMGALGDQVKEGLRQLAPLSDWYWGKDTKSDKLYTAIVNGDETYLDRMKDNYDSQSALQSAIRKGLRENDERIGEAAKAYLDGDMEEYSFLMEQIVGEGKFDEDTVRTAISAEINKVREYAKGDDAPDADSLADAYDAGDAKRAERIIEELVNSKIEENLLKLQADAYERGIDLDETDAHEEAEAKARSSVRSSVTRYWKQIYVNAYRNGDVDECEKVEDILADSGLYGNTRSLRKTLKSWRSED